MIRKNNSHHFVLFFCNRSEVSSQSRRVSLSKLVRVQPVIEAWRSFSRNELVLPLFEFRESARVFEAPLI